MPSLPDFLGSEFLGVGMQRRLRPTCPHRRVYSLSFKLSGCETSDRWVLQTSKKVEEPMSLDGAIRGCGSKGAASMRSWSGCRIPLCDLLVLRMA